MSVVVKKLSIVLLCLAISTLWIGVYKDREFREPHLFIKSKPTIKFIFYSPLGEADRSYKPGYEGYLTPEEEIEENDYVQFLENRN
jgi:hypothetical protein